MKLVYCIYQERKQFVSKKTSDQTGYENCFPLEFADQNGFPLRSNGKNIHRNLNFPLVPWDLRTAEPSSASRESLGFLI